jgi:hypothetical protein
MQFLSPDNTRNDKEIAVSWSLFEILTIAMLVSFILIWAKLVGSPRDYLWPMLVERNFVRLNIYLIVCPILISFVCLGFLSPPIAVALLYSANPLLAQVSIGNPGLSFLPLLTGTLIFVLFFRRWKDGLLSEMSMARVFQLIPFFLLLLFLLLGSIRSPFWVSNSWLTLSLSFEGLPLLLANARDAYHPLHYIYFIITHWLSFLILGMLACANLRDIKVFFLSLPVFIIGPLLGIPAAIYLEIFGRVFDTQNIEGMVGLSHANINRGFVGYLAALGVLVSVSGLFHGRKWNTLFSLALLCIYLVLLILSGSKGPVLGCVLGLCLMFLVTEKRSLIIGVFWSVGAIGLAILLSYAFGLVGILDQFFLSSHSFSTRLNLAKGALGLFASGNIGTWLLGGGFGSSTLQLPIGPGPPYVHMGSHNLFLDLLNEVGVFGLVLVLGAILWAGNTFYKKILNASPSTQKYLLSLVCSLGIVLFVKLCISTDTYGEDLLPLVVGILVGASYGAHPRYKGS